MVEGVLWAGVALLALASAGPLDRYPREAEDYQSVDLSAYANFTANEVCFSDNEVFQKGDLMPNPGPCEECRCEPPSIVCQMVKCPVNNNGCRTIQRANHCCPDYNCECDYNGQLYSDGERLDLPDQPCQVCYCKGGEVMCTSLTCYTRNDCEPQHVPGQCCPKYTNCPLRDMAVTSSDDKNWARSPNKTVHSPKREMQPWLLTKSPVQTSSAPVTKQPGDLTTAEGQVIIVSDWLTERKTTPEGSTSDHTHDVTKVGDTHGPWTELPSIINKFDRHATKSPHESASSPLDEVIFTRIDLLRNPHDKHIASTTHVLSNLLEESETTSGPSKLPGSDDIIYHTKDQWSTLTPTNSTTNSNMFIKEKRLHTDENITSQPSNSINEEKGYTTHYDSSRPGSLVVTDMSITTERKLNKEHDIEESIDNSEKAGLTQKPIKQLLEQNLSNSNYRNLSHDELKKNHDIEIGATDDLISNHVTDMKTNQVTDIVTPQSVFTLKSLGTEESRNADAIEDLNTVRDHSKGIDIIETTTYESDTTTNSETNHSADNILLNSNLEKTESDNQYYFTDHTAEIMSTISVISTETTTPYFTEDHMIVFDDVSSRFQAYQRGEEHQSSTPEEDLTTGNINTVSSSLNEKEIIETEKPHPISINNTQQKSYGFTNKTTDIKESSIDVGNNHDQPGDETTVLSNEEVHLHLKDINKKDKFPESSIQVKENSDEHIGDSVQNGSIKLSNAYASDGTKEFVGTTNDDMSDESSETIANTPPILELNSHFPFLIIGGEESSESFDDAEGLTTTDELNSFTNNDNLATTTIPDKSNVSSNEEKENFTEPLLFKNTKNSSEIRTHEKSLNKEELSGTDKDIQTTTSTSHISLTPGDLKVLAEYLINETIKPVTTNNSSKYIPNQWLQGNLTSEEKMSSIMAAANVSIGIINKTSVNLESPVPNSKLLSLGKIDKDITLKGNMVTDSTHKMLNKDKIISGKHSETQNSKNSNIIEQYLKDDSSSMVKGPVYLTLDLTNRPELETTPTNENIETATLQNYSTYNTNSHIKTEGTLALVNDTKVSNSELNQNGQPLPIFTQVSSSSSSAMNAKGTTANIEDQSNDSYFVPNKTMLSHKSKEESAQDNLTYTTEKRFKESLETSSSSSRNGDLDSQVSETVRQTP